MFAEAFGVRPWEMELLRPSELAAMYEWLDAQHQAQESAAANARRTMRGRV